MESGQKYYVIMLKRRKTGDMYNREACKLKNYLNGFIPQIICGPVVIIPAEIMDQLEAHIKY